MLTGKNFDIQDAEVLEIKNPDRALLEKKPEVKKLDECYGEETEKMILAFNELCLDYPDLKKLQKYLDDGKIIDFKQNYSITVIEVVAKELKIKHSGITILDYKPYINKSGLNNKIQNDKRKIKIWKSYPVLFAMGIKPVAGLGERDNLKYFIGTSDDGTVMYRGVIEFENGEKYEQDATANAAHLVPKYNQRKNMQPYVYQLAETRAMNRVARVATGIGLMTEEELNERGFKSLNDPASSMSPEKLEIIKSINKIFDKRKYNQAQRIASSNKYGGSPLPEEMSEKVLGCLLKALRTEQSEEKKSIKKTTVKKTTAKKATVKKNSKG